MESRTPFITLHNPTDGVWNPKKGVNNPMHGVKNVIDGVFEWLGLVLKDLIWGEMLKCGGFCIF
jgi:hypothetical protein